MSTEGRKKIYFGKDGKANSWGWLADNDELTPEDFQVPKDGIVARMVYGEFDLGKKVPGPYGWTEEEILTILHDKSSLCKASLYHWETEENQGE